MSDLFTNINDPAPEPDVAHEADQIATQITNILIDAFKAKENREPTTEEVHQLLEELTEERIAQLFGAELAGGEDGQGGADDRGDSDEAYSDADSDDVNSGPEGDNNVDSDGKKNIEKADTPNGENLETKDENVVSNTEEVHCKGSDEHMDKKRKTDSGEGHELLNTTSAAADVV